MKLGVLLYCGAMLTPCGARQIRTPDLEAQPAAMRKLTFLVGKWEGEARLLRGPGEPILMTQSEEVQYKLDDLIMVI